MGIINVLDKQTANLIAAGEVVERPASAIKELLENCADAGATKVTVEIKNGGTTYIRVTDNGCGMEKDDLKTCILRHATSKIKTKEDLSSISTLGFRGEALAAIAAVTRLSVMTKRKSDATGYLMDAEFGTVNDITETGCPDGTTIIARCLFENVPARRKFLKRDATEAHAVVAAVEKFALSKPSISVNCISDGIEKFKTPGDGMLYNTIYAALGREFSEGMIKTEYSFGGISVCGFVCKPSLCRPNRSMQNFFINERYVRSKTMCAALEEGFRSFCPTGKYPGAVLYLSVDNELVDVNIHPAKLEVKFVNEKAVFETVFYAVRNALSRAASGNTFFENNNQDAEAFISEIQQAQAKAGSANAPQIDKGKSEDAEKRAVFYVENGIAVELHSENKVESKDFGNQTVPHDGGINAKEKPAKMPSMSLEELARVFDSEKLIGEQSDGKNDFPIAPSSDSPSEKHLEFIRKLEISIPDAPAKSNIDTVHVPPTPGKAQDIPQAEAGENKYLSGIENAEFVSVTSIQSDNDNEKQNPDKIVVEEEKRPPAQPYAQTVSMLDNSDDGNSPISTQAELEKRVQRGIRIVGEVFNSYIIVEIRGELVIIDKHAAHERIIYEGMKKDVRKGAGVQLLLEPLTVTVSSKESEAISEHGSYIANAGFAFEEFGRNAFLIRGLPPLVDISDGVELFSFLAGRLAEGNGRALGDIFDKALYTAACKAAVKAGQKTSELSNAVIVDRLFSDEGVIYCPHGRPVIINFKKAKLDKMFGRT